MIINKGYKYKLKPTKQQREIFEQTVGCCRFVYNYFLHLNNCIYEHEQRFVFNSEMSAMLPIIKNENGFLLEPLAQCLQASLRNLSNAFTRFFKGIGEYPQFKKKNKSKSSFTYFQQMKVYENSNQVWLPKIGRFKYVNYRPIEGRVKSMTVYKDCEDWYVSILVEQEIEEKVKTQNNPVGIDVGLKEFAVLSTEEVAPNPKFFIKLESKLGKLQRRMARKKKGSNNKNKAKLLVAKLHAKIRNSRNDFLHKVSTRIVKNHDVICVEDLNVAGMLKNSKLAKSIQDVGWSMFNTMLKYKCLWHSKHYQQVERFYPSSQICSNCGGRKKMPLKLRTYICEDCGHTEDRDYNASKNIRQRGLELINI